MRVVYIVSTLKHSGPINVVYDTVFHLLTDNEIFIISLSPENEYSSKERFLNIGVTLKQIATSRGRFLNLISTAAQLKKYIEEINPDVIHSHGLRADLLNAYALSKYKNRVSTLHNYPYEDYRMKYGLIGEAIAYTHIKSLKALNLTVSCSQGLAERMIKHGLVATPIKNGIDVNFFKKNINKREFCKKNNLPHNKIIFISVGSLIQRKDPETILKAFSNIKEVNKILLVLGNGNLKKKLEQEYDDAEKILFLGHQPNVADFLSIADAFISSSTSEGLPLMMAEAAASGLHILCTNIDPFKEILNGYEAVRYFEVKSNKNLTNLIENYSPNKKNSASDQYLESISSKRMAIEYQELYEKLID